MHKKIIKYALVLLATASSIFAWNYTKGYEITENCFSNARTSANQCRDITNEAFQYENGYNIITNNMNFTYQGVQDYNTFFLNNINYFLYRGTDNKLHIKNGVYTGKVGNICSYGSNNISEIGAYCGIGVNREGTYGCHKNYTTDVEELYNSGGGFDKIYWLPGRIDGLYNNSAGGVLCMIKGNGAYCILLNNGFSPNSNNNCASRYNANIYTGYIQDDSIQNYGLNELETEFTTSPFNGGGGGGGGGPNTQITQYSCPTIQQLINTYGQQYNTGLCYSSTLIYTGGTIQTIEAKTIFELYPTYTGFTQAINLYYNYCTAPATQETCNNAFRGNELGRTIINKLPNDVKNSSIYQYCNLQLNYEDKNATTCTLGQTGTLAPGITINDIVNEIGNQDISVVTPGTPPEGEEGNGSGSVFDNLIGENEEDTERRNIIENAKNIVQTMKELYAKFTGIFRGRSGTEGFIPEYITGILLLIILYKLFKK